MDLFVSLFWIGLGIFSLSEKSPLIVESEGVSKEEKSNLTFGSYLLILVYLERAQSKGLQR